LGGSIHAITKNTETLVVAGKGIGVEVNAGTTKYIVVSQDQNAGQNHNVKTENKFFERAEQFRYLGKTLTNQNSIQEEIKSTLKSGSACFHYCHIFLFSSLLSKNIKIEIYRTAHLHVVLYGCETWSKT
jgi:hypothetical protein